MNSYKQITELVLKVKELEASDNFKQQLNTDAMKDIKKIWTSWKNLGVKTETALNEITVESSDSENDDEIEDKKPSVKKASAKKQSTKKNTDTNDEDIKQSKKKASAKKQSVKKSERIEDSEDEEPRKPRGFMIPKKITKEVSDLLELADNVELNQPELCKNIINYYKKNSDDNDAKVIKLDEHLRGILQVEDTIDEINQKELRKYIKNCYA